jgi:hypothetical protein
MPPEATRRTVFIDRNSGGRTFRDLLRQADIKAILHDEVLGAETPDEEWLRLAGDEGWLVVTGDNQTTRSPLFLRQLQRSNVHVFVLIGLNGASREGKARCIIDCHEQLCHLAATNPAPSLWRVGKDGRIRSVDFKSTLEKRERRWR